ncbi:MAG: cupin domain-containing protein [Candidatus Sericytochromatia bacterium]
MDLFHKPLSKILAPVTPADFATGIYGRQPLHIPNPTAADRFTSLFNWDSLNRLLNLSLSSEASPGLRIFKDQRNFIFKKAGENAGRILKHIRQGGTLILENIDKYDPTLATFLDALSDEIAAQTRINLYMSCPGKQGYPIHYDTHDFLILQVYGYKRWDIYPGTVPWPMFPPPTFQSPLDEILPAYDPPPEESRIQQVLLAPGDVLYVPKGYWHKALAEDAPSLHLTLGMYLKTGVDFMQWLVTQMQEIPEFRQPFPFITKEALPEQASGPSPYEPRIDQLKAGLAALISDPLLAVKFHQASYSTLQRRQAFFLPQQYAADKGELVPWQHFRVVSLPHYLVQQPDGLVELIYAHEKLTFAAPAHALLRYMLTRESFSRADLEARFSAFAWNDILDVLLPLVQDGIIEPVNR